MQIIPISQIHIPTLVADINAGKTLVYPTETCYGLGCLATDSAAVENVFAIKGRETQKSVLMLVSHKEIIARYADWNDTLESLARQYWPGPLTIVLPIVRPENLAPGVIGQDGTAAFRVTNHTLSHSLVEALGEPLVSTSANRAGEQNLYSADAVIQTFSGNAIEPDLVIDGGSLPEKPPTTIVRVVGGKVEVLRQGEVRVIS